VRHQLLTDEKAQPRQRLFPFLEACNCSARQGLCSIYFCPQRVLSPRPSRTSMGSLGGPQWAVRARTLLSARLLSIFPSKPTFASCEANSWARTGATTTARSRSYDLMYSLPPGGSKFTISILGSRKAGCSGLSRYLKAPTP